MTLKRIIPLLCLCLVLMMLPLTVSANKEVIASGLHDAGPIEWKITADGTLTITGGRTMQTTTYGWANYADKVTKIVFKGGMKSIGERAFANMVNVTAVDLGNAMEFIDPEAFWGCTSLRSVSFPATMELIDRRAFNNCSSLTKITFSSETKSLTIGDYAFTGVPVTKLTIPGGVKLIADYAFYDCQKLKTLNLSEGLEEIGYKAFDCCPALSGDLYLPASLESLGMDNFSTNSWTSVQNHRYYTGLSFEDNDSIKKVIFGGEAVDTGYRVFENCTNLKTVIFNADITEISDYSFMGCKSLSSIELPKTLTSIGEHAFKNSGLKQVIIPSSVTEIQDSAFYKCPIKEIYFVGKAPSIGNEVFRDVAATVYYPKDDASWTKKVKKNYGGELTWVPYSASAPEIVEQPKNTYTKTGDTTYVSLTAEGIGLKYQWYIKNAGSKKYSKSSVTSSTYSCTMNEKAKDRYVYCVVTDQNGNSVKSKTVVLREAVSIITEPKTGYAKQGKTVKVSVEASGDVLTYQWYIKNAGASKYSKSSVTSDTYSAKMSDKVHGRRVYCVVTDKYGKTVQSKTVLLRMAATITTQPKNVTVAEGKTAKVTVKAVGDELTYTWYIKNEGASKFSKSSVTKSSYSVKMSEKADGRQVYCVVTDKYGKTAKSNTVTLTMK